MKKLIPILSGFILVSCTGATSPSGVVKAFLEAGRKGDRSVFMNCLRQRDRELLEKQEAKQGGKQGLTPGLIPPEGADYRIGEETIVGETATVSVLAVQDGKEKTRQMRLVREGGRWKIALIPDEMLRMLDGVERMKTLGTGGAGGPGTGKPGSTSTR